jgi:hypothetical protein
LREAIGLNNQTTRSYRPSDQGREAELAEAWRRRRGQPADSPADGVAGPSTG